MNIKKNKLMIYALVLAFAISILPVFSTPVEAKIKTVKGYDYSTTLSPGDTLSFSDVASLSVGKKGKKGIKKVKTSTYKNAFRLVTKGYYANEDAYGSQEKYDKARSHYKYKNAYSYRLYFLKPGTYKITYYRYESSVYSTKYLAKLGRYVGYYSPGRRVKYTYKVLVQAATRSVKSVKLGNAINYSATSDNNFTFKGTSKINPFVTSTNPKLTVTMAKGHKLRRIEVNSGTGYRVVSNKSKVAINTYSYDPSYAPATYVRVYYTYTYLDSYGRKQTGETSSRFTFYYARKGASSLH